MDSKNYVFLIILTLLISCDERNTKSQAVDNFVFSKSALHSDYSMKFSNNDTVFVEQRFPWPTEHFYFLIKEKDKQNILKFASEIQFSKYDSIYDQFPVNHLVDGTGYKFYVEKGNKKNWIYIYGDTGPIEFHKFSASLNFLKEKQTLHKTNKIVDFGNLEHILLPEPPKPPKIVKEINSR